MSYIGQNLPTDVFGGYTTDTFAGDGSATTFTLSQAPFNEQGLIVVINNVIQQPTTNYTVSGTTLTIVGTAVASGDVIYARHTGVALPIGQADRLVSNNLTINDTEIDLSSGNLTLDVAGEINLDADDGKVRLKDGGTEVARFVLDNGSGDLEIVSSISDKDIKLKGIDGGANVTALTLDMSDAGAATLNNGLTLTDGNLTVASGHGINFAADANATNMSAELLDDYEEGTWTGVYKSTAGVMTMSSNTTGRYVKIGRFVLVTGYFGAAANNNANTSQTLQLSGLPFTVGSNDNTYYTGQAVSYYTGLALSTGAVPAQYAAVNDTVLVFTQLGIGTADVSSFLVSNLSEDGAMMVSASYYTIA